jgi:hypothetical protein
MKKGVEAERGESPVWQTEEIYAHEERGESTADKGKNWVTTKESYADERKELSCTQKKHIKKRVKEKNKPG